jgi:hypothetical protein
MKTKLMILACLLAGSAQAEYLVYELETGKILRHDKTMEVLSDETGNIYGEHTDKTAKLGSTTNDMNATVYTNVSQIVLVPLKPKDLKANMETISPEVLKAVVAAIVKSVNARLPGTNKITAAEIRQNIKDALP